jgi:hypothetical protein
VVIQLDNFSVCMPFPLPEDFMICSGNAHDRTLNDARLVQWRVQR